MPLKVGDLRLKELMQKLKDAEVQLQNMCQLNDAEDEFKRLDEDLKKYLKPEVVGEEEEKVLKSINERHAKIKKLMEAFTNSSTALCRIMIDVTAIQEGPLREFLFEYLNKRYRFGKWQIGK